MKRFVLEFATNGSDDIVNLSPDLAARLGDIAGEGLLHLFAVGSTCALTTLEYEPGLVKHDLAAALERIAPADGRYEHETTWNDDNGHSHVRSALLGPSLTVPFGQGRLLTGEYQQVVFIDFDTRPRRRAVIVSVLPQDPLMTQPQPLIQTSNTAVLIVDLQERLLPAMHEKETCVESARKLIEAAVTLGVPVLATEQYPAGLGATCATIRQALGSAPVVEKVRFSSCVEGITGRLRETGRANVLVAGIEGHVCVQQTVLDLLRLGYRPYVCADAVSSRRGLDCQTALGRMRQAGAIVTTVESVVFELLGEAGTESFKKILRIVK